jgi:hypothetical protein
LEALIPEFMDASRIHQGFVRAMWGERMLQLEFGAAGLAGAAQFMGAGWVPLWARVGEYPVRPLFARDALHIIQHTTAVAQAIDQPFQRASSAISITEPGDSILDHITHPLCQFILPSFEYFFLPTHRACAMRQLAGIALAIRLYELDHGSRPQQLRELVPEYLAELPADPFGDGRATYMYHPDADPPVLYSIGSNGVDDGGVLLSRRDDGDTPFFLNGIRPEPIDADEYRASKSSKADEDQDTEETETK